MDTLDIDDTRIHLTRGDITEQEVDAIVNAANSSLMGGGGVDGAIHRRGGPEILQACKTIRQTDYPDGLPTGEAVATTAGNLVARAVIHTVGPRWHGGGEDESSLLENAYRNSLKIAREEGYRTIAFPSISTGAYGYPIDQAASIAIAAVIDAVHEDPGAFDEIRFVLFSATDHERYARALDELSRKE